ncbi:MAG TPA: TolC family protein [Drouetiella sp.]
MFSSQTNKIALFLGVALSIGVTTQAKCQQTNALDAQHVPASKWVKIAQSNQSALPAPLDNPTAPDASTASSVGTSPSDKLAPVGQGLPDPQPINLPNPTLTLKDHGIKTKQPILLEQHIQADRYLNSLSLADAVGLAQQNYPAVLRARAQVDAARTNVKVQKITEYMPDSLLQYQEIMASRNKLTQIIYGSPVFPGNPGPGFNSTNFEPLFFSGLGFNLDWAPLDFGLHKAKIELAKERYNQTASAYRMTVLDVQIAAASAFLDVVEAQQEMRAAQENVNSFSKFSTIVHAAVDSSLKPAADASLSDAQLANSQNQLYRAELNMQVAQANLANALGVAGSDIHINNHNIVEMNEQAQVQQTKPVFEQVPILQNAREGVLTAFRQRKVLDKEYFPVFHFLGGFQLRGSGMDIKGKRTGADVEGLAPVSPNYQTAMIMNWNFLDYFRLKAEKQVQNKRIAEMQHQYNLVLNNLKTEDIKSRARVRTALAIAANMPPQVHAATMAVNQAEARYKVGLSSVAQVAEANQMLAQSRMQEAIAKVGVWRAMLSVSSVHGDLKPFVAEASRVQGM